MMPPTARNIAKISKAEIPLCRHMHENKAVGKILKPDIMKQTLIGMYQIAAVKQKKLIVPAKLLPKRVNLNSFGTPEKNGSPKQQTKIAEEIILNTERKNANSKTLTSFAVSTSFETPYIIEPKKLARLTHKKMQSVDTDYC